MQGGSSSGGVATTVGVPCALAVPESGSGAASASGRGARGGSVKNPGGHTPGSRTFAGPALYVSSTALAASGGSTTSGWSRRYCRCAALKPQRAFRQRPSKAWRSALRPAMARSGRLLTKKALELSQLSLAQSLRQ